MRLHKTHLSKLYRYLISELILFFLVISCKKIKDVDKPQAEDYWAQKFFQIPVNASDALKAVISEIKKQNDKHHFAATVAVKYGLPSWNKTVSNTPSQNSPLGRGTTGDSTQIFLIPFRGSDSSVTAYLTCARNNNEYTFRFYKRDYLSRLYAQNDTVKLLREGLLSVIGFFEKQINQKDSTLIAGTENKIFKDVTININGTPVNAIGRGADAGLSILQVCYSVSGNGGGGDGGGGSGPPARVEIIPSVRCINVGVYGSLIDLGFTTSNGYTSGGGSSGGGSIGGNSFPDGFVCPQTEWWCESGDFRFVNGVLYTPYAYPGVEDGYPWLWWESPNAHIIDSLKNYPCAQEILKQLPSLNDTAKIILKNVFDVDSLVNITFLADTTLPQNVNAFTQGSSIQFDPNTGYFNVKIRINSWILINSSKEFIIKTMFHEAIHAYIDYHWKKYSNGFMDSTTFKNQFPKIWYYKKTPYSNLAQHTEIANSYVDDIISIVRSYNSLVADSTNKAISWSGLYETQAWKDLGSDTLQMNRLRIISRSGTAAEMNALHLNKCD